MSTAVLVFSDPAGGDEALGRLFNALALTHDLQQRGQPVELVFQGAGTRWVAQVTQPDHPAHALYRSVEGAIGGVSCACSDVFGARADAEQHGVALRTANAIPGTSGLHSIADHLQRGDTVLTF